MKRKQGLLSFPKAVLKEIKKNKGSFYIFIFLFIVTAIIMIFEFLADEQENVFLCLLTLLLFLVPPVLEVVLNVNLPSNLEILLLSFIFAANILGRVFALYDKIAYWDILLHAFSGFLFAAIGFSFIDIVNNKPGIELELSPLFLVSVAFCFSMTIGVFWEFFEFSIDQFFLLDMQKDTVIQQISSTLLDPNSQNARIIIDGIENTTINGELLDINGYLDIGLLDTMEDLLANFVGAVLFSIFGYIYGSRDEKGFLKNFLISKNTK